MKGRKMAINPIDDIMQYYLFNFVSIYIIMLFSIILFIASLKNKNLILYSLILSFLVGIGLFFQLYFIGVLSDNRAPNLDIWFAQSLIFSCITLVLFIIQCIRLFIRLSKTKKQALPPQKL